MTTSPRYAEIDTPQAVADTFVELTWNTHEVTIRFDGTMIQYPATVVSVDRTLGRCVLDMTGTADIEQLLKAKQSFVLYARQHSAALQSGAMHCIGVAQSSARLSVCASLPDSVALLKRRGQFRAALNDSMAVMVLLASPTGREWQTTLRDLSAGGCLLSLPQDEQDGLEVGVDGYSVQALFPNGETFEVLGHVSHRYVNTETQQCYLGMAFDIRVDKAAREVWRYVREVEREVARQTSPRSEMRPLAPSPLFTTPTKTAK
ncbi:metal dependent phosphohydrolase [Salinisphaera shabanensis T35B1]|jgi:c-di-GMP-binding flagellar brake protein YcgR|uniref:flagellar brake protein n=1 Tax=Salinisphaera shabanensis TaxID=180542 RepID=UPI00333FEDB0